MKRVILFSFVLVIVIFVSPAAVNSGPPGQAKPFDNVTVQNANIDPVPVVDLLRALGPFQETLPYNSMRAIWDMWSCL
jgi:hypothetical protein